MHNRGKAAPPIPLPFTSGRGPRPFPPSLGSAPSIPCLSGLDGSAFHALALQGNCWPTDLIRGRVVQAVVEEGNLGDVKMVLCEGALTINSQLIAAGVVDEINVTLSPLFAMGDSKRIASGVELDPPVELVLDRALRDDRSRFLHYLKE